MKTRVILFAVLAITLGPPFAVQAQEIELPTFTPEERWERASRLWAVSGVASIAYAKSVGQTVEEYSEAVADLMAPGWGEPGSGTLNIIGGMCRNFMAFAGSEFELVEQTEESVTARSNRPWTRYFGEDEMWYGVSQGEYEKSFQVFNSRLAEHLGLAYEEWTEDGWLYLKFGLKG